MKYQSYININEISKNYQNNENFEITRDSLYNNLTKREESFNKNNPYLYSFNFKYLFKYLK